MFSISYWTIRNKNKNDSALEYFEKNISSIIIPYWFTEWWYKPVVLSSVDIKKNYIDNTKLKFLKLLTDGRLSSSNIDILIYNKKAFHQVIMDSDNILEKSWKSRLLIESTPIGNIVMFYDIFKQGFSYYCDQPVVPYDILNSVAMKYVMKFSCIDFFMDEYILGDYGSSPLKNIFIEDDDDDDEKKDKKKTSCNLDVDLKSAPFAKFKNYSTSKKDKNSNISNKTPIYFRTNYPWLWKIWYRIQYYLVLPVYKISIWSWSSIISLIFGKTWRKVEVEKSEIIENTFIEKEKIQNKFIYLGRFRNLNFLQKYKKKNNIFGEVSTKYDSMFNFVNNKTISYKDFKAGSMVVS